MCGSTLLYLGSSLPNIAVDTVLGPASSCMRDCGGHTSLLCCSKPGQSRAAQLLLQGYNQMCSGVGHWQQKWCDCVGEIINGVAVHG